MTTSSSPTRERNVITDHLWRLFLNGVVRSTMVPAKWRWLMLRLAGMQVERKAVINEGVTFTSPNVKIGTYAWIGPNVTLDGSAAITIGPGCSLAMGTTLVTGTHEIGPQHRRAGTNIAAPIVLEDGCWLGANVTVLPGVTIGSGCVIGAGSIVTKDCQPDGLYVGQPARWVRRVDDARDRS